MLIKQHRKTVVALALACWSTQVIPANAQQQEFVADICGQHLVSSTWGSQHTATGKAQLHVNPETNRLSLELNVRDFSPEDFAPAGPDGILGAIHIHNYPQGGPRFFVQQLPGQVTPTDTGFTFSLKDWPMSPPKGGAKVSVEFVISEILSGNAYIGVHSSQILCSDAARRDIACAAPATALSGTLISVAGPADSEC